jgi:hypothetical protein
MWGWGETLKSPAKLLHGISDHAAVVLGAFSNTCVHIHLGLKPICGCHTCYFVAVTVQVSFLAPLHQHCKGYPLRATKWGETFLHRSVSFGSQLSAAIWDNTILSPGSHTVTLSWEHHSAQRCTHIECRDVRACHVRLSLPMPRHPAACSTCQCTVCTFTYAAILLLPAVGRSIKSPIAGPLTEQPHRATSRRMVKYDTAHGASAVLQPIHGECSGQFMSAEVRVKLLLFVTPTAVCSRLSSCPGTQLSFTLPLLRQTVWQCLQLHN